MKMKFTIPRTGDGGQEDTTSFLMRVNGVRWKPGMRPNRFGERTLRVPQLDIRSRFSKTLDPMTENIAYTIRQNLIPNTHEEEADTIVTITATMRSGLPLLPSREMMGMP